VLAAAEAAKPGSAVVVGALRAPLPLTQLATRFERLTLSDLDLPALEELCRRELAEPLRAKVRLERYDVTGSYLAFAEGVAQAVTGAASLLEAERALLDLLQSYDVGAGSAGLTEAEGRADLAISPLLLSSLGRGYAACAAQALGARGWDESSVTRAPLAPALELLRRLVEQHHIAALLRRAELGLLISAVSEVDVGGAAHPGRPAGEPHDLLGVESLSERLPEMAQVKQDWRWEWRLPRSSAGEKGSLLTLVEAVLV
jgi:hypothetical protein